MLRGASTGETEGPGPMLDSAGEKPESFCTYVKTTGDLRDSRE